MKTTEDHLRGLMEDGELIMVVGVSSDGIGLDTLMDRAMRLAEHNGFFAVDREQFSDTTITAKPASTIFGKRTIDVYSVP